MLRTHYSERLTEAGCDEAGRGCLAGPVFAAAVILPRDYKNPVINDSKKLSAPARQVLRAEIENDAIAWSVASADHTEIDRINILNASILAMHRAIEGLKLLPELLLIDGNRFKPYPGIDHVCVVGGDACYMSIAAASILAKTYRDDFMEVLSADFPQYGWSQNKGYPTIMHRRALAQSGPSPYHRSSFVVKSLV